MKVIVQIPCYNEEQTLPFAVCDMLHHPLHTLRWS